MKETKDIRDILAYGWSVIMYPLFVPTYLMIFFCKIVSIRIAPISPLYSALAIGGTFFFTCVIPLVMLLIMLRTGRVKDMDVSDPKERTTPYIYTLTSMIFWCVFMHQIQMPLFMRLSAIATVVVLLIVMLITLRWKISVHSASAGGSLAIIIAIILQYELNPWFLILFWSVVCWLLMIARIRLNAHTPLQTVCGFLLGLITVLIPNLIIIYA